MATLLDTIVQEYHVDEERIYVTGLSMGGYGTWALAAYQPDPWTASHANPELYEWLLQHEQSGN